MKRFFVLGIFLVLFSILLAGCGGSEDNMTPVSSLSVEMSEFKFNPAAMVVFAGQEITLNLSNTGGVEHDFIILKKSAAAKIPFDSEKQAADILFDFKLESKGNGQFKFTLPEAGEYQVVCGVQGHMEAGMVATLTAK